MGFLAAVYAGLQLRGRASRAEFWCFVIFVGLVLGGVWAYEIYGLKTSDHTAVGVAALLLSQPSLAILIRRLHDRNRSGRWLIPPVLFLGLAKLALMTNVADVAQLARRIGLVALSEIFHSDAGRLALQYAPLTFAGLATLFDIVLVSWLLLRGTPGTNRYGEDPLSRVRIFDFGRKFPVGRRDLPSA